MTVRSAGRPVELAASPGYRDIAPADLARGGRARRVVDVREPEEFSGPLGHIAGADLVPLAILESCAARWDHEEQIAVVCRSGKRSARAAVLLVRLGFKDVLNVEGGMQAHVGAGLPVAR